MEAVRGGGGRRRSGVRPRHGGVCAGRPSHGGGGARIGGALLDRWSHRLRRPRIREGRAGIDCGAGLAHRGRQPRRGRPTAPFPSTPDGRTVSGARGASCACRQRRAAARFSRVVGRSRNGEAQHLPNHFAVLRDGKCRPRRSTRRLRAVGRQEATGRRRVSRQAGGSRDRRPRAAAGEQTRVGAAGRRGGRRTRRRAGPVHQPRRGRRIHRHMAQEDARVAASIRRERRRTAGRRLANSSYELGESGRLRGVVRGDGDRRPKGRTSRRAGCATPSGTSTEEAIASTGARCARWNLG